jgi:sugar phosphate isomerase/epimerase
MKPLQIGMCSWSLKAPTLAEALQVCKEQIGLNLIQLGGFSDQQLADPQATIDTVRASGIEVSATCVSFPGENYKTIEIIAQTGGYVPDDMWEDRLARTVKVRDITAMLGVGMLTTHIGFVPHDPSSAGYRTMRQRLQTVADCLAEKNVTLTMETGQEPADVLLQFIADVGRPNIKVNFDPGNVILYGIGDPVEAAEKLAPYIAHMHCKDATASDEPGVKWGQEVPLGQGQARLGEVIRTLKTRGYSGPLVIEREAGPDRIGDIRTGIQFLNGVLG